MLKVLGLENESEWLGIVKGFQNHDVYHLPQYTKAFHVHGDGDPMLFYYQADHTQAINVVFKRDIARCSQFAGAIPANTYFDISTPYGYGGFLIEGETSEPAIAKLNDAYTDYCISSGIISEFVRFHPLLNNHLSLAPMYEIMGMGPTVYLDLSSPEIIESNIYRKTRNRIRKAKDSGVTVSMGNSAELYTLFEEMYNETMRRNNAQPYYFFEKTFYDSLRTDMKDNALIFYAVCQEEIICMEILLLCRNYMHAHLQGMRYEYRPLSPGALITYEEALWGNERGMERLHLGGGLGSKEDSIYKHKYYFNMNTDSRFYTGRKIFDPEKYEFLLRLRGQAPSDVRSPGFFPAYRA